MNMGVVLGDSVGIIVGIHSELAISNQYVGGGSRN